MSSCLLYWLEKPIKKGSTLKGTNVLPLRVDPHSEGRQNMKELLPLKEYHSP